MKYNKVKNAGYAIDDSKYVIKNPEKYKGKWKEVFNNDRPIMLELGSGRGSFIIKMALAHPNLNFIGLELDLNQIGYAAQSLISNRLTNLKFIHADAKSLGDIFFKEINTIYLTFSEPWPKKQDERKRFTHESYLRLYDRVFKKNKHIVLKTDNKILFASSLENLSKYWYTFETVSMDLHRDERKIENIMTDFEKEYYKNGRQIYYLDAYFKN
jgi:tRNA (guanine-N7-)-methyltransferase